MFHIESPRSLNVLKTIVVGVVKRFPVNEGLHAFSERDPRF